VSDTRRGREPSRAPGQRRSPASARAVGRVRGIACSSGQGRQGSNLRPSVLETGTSPFGERVGELVPLPFPLPNHRAGGGGLAGGGSHKRLTPSLSSLGAALNHEAPRRSGPRSCAMRYGRTTQRRHFAVTPRSARQAAARVPARQARPCWPETLRRLSGWQLGATQRHHSAALDRKRSRLQEQAVAVQVAPDDARRDLRLASGWPRSVSRTPLPRTGSGCRCRRPGWRRRR
jgi:hypothetical protein